MPGADDLYVVARELLDAAAYAVATYGAGPIAHQYVSPGLPAWDCCEQLTVWAGPLALAATSPLNPTLQQGLRVGHPGTVNLATLVCQVTRCVPVQDTSPAPPPAADIEAAAAATLKDVWAIWNHLKGAYRAGTLFVGPDGEPREMFMDSPVPADPQGGIAGWTIPVRVHVQGFDAP